MRTSRVIMITAVALCAAIGCNAGDNVKQTGKLSPAEVNRDNYTIQLHGNYTESTPLDLSLTGSGPEFSIELAEPCMSFRATLQLDGDRIGINYELSVEGMIPRGTRYAGVAADNKIERVPSFEIRQFTLRGSAVLSSGKPLTIATVNQNKLELTVTKSTE